MADIATVFTGWTPEMMGGWTLSELSAWRDRAARRAAPAE